MTTYKRAIFLTTQQTQAISHQLTISRRRRVGMGDTRFFKPIRYQGVSAVSIPNCDTDTIKYEPSSKVLLWHIIIHVAKIEHNCRCQNYCRQL